ncbi:MAG: 2Fe-2S iron-sulfur cluster-binding protein [Paracoccaceae bacterium]|nr:2Fe-2S iron-sulfur cluster-binding protein [Paracoccaceae bacterium]
MSRLPPPYGSRIDRSRSLAFTFEGRRFEGHPGDTIASALAANGQWMLSRSFKYHRPRGAMSFAGTDANTLVQVGPEPNVAADLTPLEDGMEIAAQNVNGSLARDRDAVIGRFARFLPVGFYYRTFMGPTKDAWLKLWEPRIRAKAGLGVIGADAPDIAVDKATWHADVAVIGGGPAGIAAALEAARAGSDVVLIDDQPALGGHLAYTPEAGAVGELVAEVDGAADIRVLTDTICTGLFEDNWLALARRDRLIRLRAAEVVLATGCIEQPAIFHQNDLPGVLTAGGVRRLMHLYGVAPGRRAVVYAADPEGYRVAEELRAAGVEVAAIVDPAPGAAAPEGMRVVAGHIAAARGVSHVTGVEVGGEGIACDTLVVAAGEVPAWQLPAQAGAKLGYDDATGRFVLDLETPGVRLAGGLAGEGATPVGAPPMAPHPKGKDFIDFDEDLQVKDILNAVKEGYSELELVKRFSTVGMGPSQGRHSALATARLVAGATGRSVGEIGVTTARPPTAPETLGALAGPHHVAERRTALHREHLRLGAEMRPVGAWWRPYLYGSGDRSALIEAEVRAVRDGVGVLDVSTLGTLEVRGPDASAFLDRLYTMAHATQPVGKVRYCLMLNEMGTVIDDGVAYRLAEDRFYVTATTGAVPRVYADMAFWNAQWRLDVDVVNLTAGFAGFNITGPFARDVVAALDGDIDFSAEAFPYLTGRSGQVAGVPVHAMRIGFTGELSFELHCPASRAGDLWAAILAAGEPVGLKPYGLEASRILRLEKGHILIGQDTDALTSPEELGFGWAVSKKKPFFVGKRALEMRRRLGSTRKLAALTFAPDAELPGESCLVLRSGAPVGHVTSVAHSPTLGHGIALAFIHAEDAEEGRRVAIRARSGRMVEGTVVGHAFYDPQNERQML